MLGYYENFPENVHKTLAFTISVSSRKIQQSLIQFLNKTNNNTLNLDEIAVPSIPNCVVFFEWGIAEGNNFTYLDTEETNKILDFIQKKPLQIMDFYCALKYYKVQNGKKTPLKFDYHIMRVAFNENLMKIQVYHEKGPRYVVPEELINFVTRGILEMFPKRVMKFYSS